MPWATRLATSVVIAAFVCLANSQEAGDKVILNSSNAASFPIHPSGTDSRYFRSPNGTTGVVQSIQPQTGWLEITAPAGQRGLSKGPIENWSGHGKRWPVLRQIEHAAKGSLFTNPSTTDNAATT